MEQEMPQEQTRFSKMTTGELVKHYRLEGDLIQNSIAVIRYIFKERYIDQFDDTPEEDTVESCV